MNVKIHTIVVSVDYFYKMKNKYICLKGKKLKKNWISMNIKQNNDQKIFPYSLLFKIDS